MWEITAAALLAEEARPEEVSRHGKRHLLCRVQAEEVLYGLETLLLFCLQCVSVLKAYVYKYSRNVHQKRLACTNS